MLISQRTPALRCKIGQPAIRCLRREIRDPVWPKTELPGKLDAGKLLSPLAENIHGFICALIFKDRHRHRRGQRDREVRGCRSGSEWLLGGSCWPAQGTLEATATEVRQSNSRALVVVADISDPIAVGDLFAKTRDAFGRLDLLFNNAGISGPAIPLEDLRLTGGSRSSIRISPALFFARRKLSRS